MQVVSLPSSGSISSVHSDWIEESFRKHFASQATSSDFIQAAQEIISIYEEALQHATESFRLVEVLRGMIIHAPTTQGSLYAAVAILLANQEEEPSAAIIGLARAWVDDLLLPSALDSPSLCLRTVYSHHVF